MNWMDENIPLLGNFIRSPFVVEPITCEKPVPLATYPGKQLTYQWKLDGTLLPGATQSSIMATVPGTYSVDVTLADSCYIETLTTPTLSRIASSQQSGNWQTPDTWECGSIPTVLDEVIIRANHSITLDGPGKALNLKLETDARIVQQANAGLSFGH